uniref:Putative methyltransferase n=1 Tax=viral metagenome TaxID=1070528 RepID=A0A6M3J9B3_9ZZZZ
MRLARPPERLDPDQQALASRRLNVGCGQYPILYWTNLDADPKAIADLHVRVPPLPFEDGALDEIYAGHFLEHLTPKDARAFLAECFRCLTPGGKLGIVVPDTREILRRYLDGALDCIEFPVNVYWSINDLDTLCALFFYHTDDPTDRSPHLWSYDETTLRRALEGAEFTITGAIDRYRDPRIPVGAFYQFGFDAVKP